MNTSKSLISVSETGTDRIPELDGLRGLAVIPVLFYHAGQLTVYTGDNWIIIAFFKFCAFGWSGVDLFFVLSGFLICGILLDNKNAVNYFRVFYLRRCFRILPLYYAFLFGFLVLVLLREKAYPGLPDGLFVFNFPAWTYFAFVQNFFMSWQNNLGFQSLAVTWSLAVEEQFYLTFPLLIRSFNRKVLLRVFVILIVLGFFLQMMVYAFYSLETVAGRILMPMCLDAFGFGALGAILIRSKKGSDLVKKHVPKLYAIFFGLILLTIFMEGRMYVRLTFFILLLLIITSKSSQILRRLFRSRILREFGRLSYCIYLTHMFFLAIVCWVLGFDGTVKFGFEWVSAICLGMSVTFLVAFVSWRYFEKPLIEYGHRFKYEKA